MSKVGAGILRGLKDAVAFHKGDRSRGRLTRVRVPARIDVKRLRNRFGLTQAQFAERFGFTLSAIRDWEQSRRLPQGSARALLTIIEKEPEAVLRALRAS